jgi:Gpi18-like mannosyltransferase
MTNNKKNNQGAPVFLWLGLRILTVFTAILAYVYDNGGWAGKSLKILLTEPWYRYDTFYYVRIVSAGYQAGDVTSGFHPLHPWLSTLAAAILKSPIAGLMFVSTVAGFFLTIVFYRLARVDLDHKRAWTATALMLCWPVTVAIFVPYTEALFLLLAVSCLLAARKRQFLLAGLLGGLAALTRQHGILLVLPLAWELWEASGRKLKALVTSWNAWLSLALVPTGYAVWIVYRALAISDFKPDFSSAQRFVYSVMVSPTAYHVYSDQQFIPPWLAAWKAIVAYWNVDLHFSAYGDAFLAVVFITMFVAGWRYLRPSYRIYCLAVLLIALSYHTGTKLNPYISLPRHMLPAFPVFLGMAQAYRFQRLPFILGILIACQMLYISCFVWQTWVL